MLEEDTSITCTCREMKIANAFRMVELVKDRIDCLPTDSSGILLTSYVKQYEQLEKILDKLYDDLAQYYGVELPQ